jgi:hypothetical protein
MTCTEDFGSPITNLGNFPPMENVTPSLQLINDTSFDVGKCDYHDMTLPEQNAFKYIYVYVDT